MIFKVGPWAYRVRIKDDLRDGQGSEKAGICDWEQHFIWIDGSMPVRRRMAVLFHELRHAWQAEMGRTADDESDANQVASFAADVWRQLERMGGEAALMRLREDGIVDPAVADDETPGEVRSAQCPQCNGLLNFPVRVSVPAYDDGFHRLAVQCAADCDFCGHVVTWREASTTAGKRTGNVLGEPVIRADHAAPCP